MKATHLTPSDEITLLENCYEFIIPKYREAHDIMVAMLDFAPNHELRIADLGCGFADLSLRILQHFPLASVFGIDRNGLILQRARSKFLTQDMNFVPFQHDLNNNTWTNGLVPLDAVVSSFTLDYLPLPRHQDILVEAIQTLNPGGRWISCEFFEAEDSRINRVFHDLEMQYIRKALQDGLLDHDQVERLGNSSILRQPHYLCTVDTKVNWLRDASYRSVSVPWRFLNLAVISATK